MRFFSLEVFSQNDSTWGPDLEVDTVLVFLRIFAEILEYLCNFAICRDSPHVMNAGAYFCAVKSRFLNSY
jgi:hypothetical protein